MECESIFLAERCRSRLCIDDELHNIFARTPDKEPVKEIRERLYQLRFGCDRVVVALWSSSKLSADI
jgi:hypothetical protein